MFNPFGGKAVDVQIELDRPDRPYYPGDAVRATISVKGEGGGRARELRAGLVLWHEYEIHWQETKSSSSGGTDTDYKRQTEHYENWMHREVLNSGSIPGGFDQTYTFEWPIPSDAPPPCRGEKTKTRYLVKVTLDRVMARDQNEELEVPVVVPPTGSGMEAGEYGTTDHPDDARLQLWLPKVEFVEGETIAGRLFVDAARDLDVREIRVELRRNELVVGPHPSSSNTWTVGADRFLRNEAHKTEPSLKLASGQSLKAGSPLQLDFELTVPANGCPTLYTPNSQVTYELVGTLDRSMRSDVNVRQDVTVYNGSGPS